MQTNIIKIILSVLLVLCLFDMPYGYYQLVRIVSCAGFIYLAYLETEEGSKNLSLIYIVLMLIFQPILKLALNKFEWNVIDVGVSIFLIITIFVKNKK